MQSKANPQINEGRNGSVYKRDCPGFLSKFFPGGRLLVILLGLSESRERVKSAHVHFNLHGFIAIVIYGVGYCILNEKMS
jgi:hypothetical protein